MLDTTIAVGNKIDLARRYLLESDGHDYSAPVDERLTLLERDNFTVAYAPFDYVNERAAVIIIGLTPGRFQAISAARSYQSACSSGAGHTKAMEFAKREASFGGPMRSNLVSLLDHIGLNRFLGISSAGGLFEPDSKLAHFTSAVRYPVFKDGQNFSGRPAPAALPWMMGLAEQWLGEELKTLPGRILVPLGPKVTQVLERLCAKGYCEEHQILSGLPHPSGANAERISYFLGRKSRSLLSRKTNPEALDRARAALKAKLDALSVVSRSVACR